MRFVAAIVSFVLAFVVIGIGLAQRTVFAPPDNLTAVSETKSDAPVTVIDGETLNAMDGRQNIEILGADGVIAVYGRSSDVTAWIGDTTHNVLSFDAQSSSLEAAIVRGQESTVPSALGSDLWLAEYSSEAELQLTLNLPEKFSVLVMSNGTDPAPQNIAVSWPIDSSTPWFGPLIAGGIALLVLGVGLFLWGIYHHRKTRGPQRTPNKQQKLPRPPRYSGRKAAKAVKPGAPKAIESSKGRRTSGRRMVALPAVMLIPVLLAGCSPSNWPQFGASPSPSPSALAEVTETTTVLPPAVSEKQLQEIMSDIAAVATEADASTDSELLATRFEGPALEVREANYVKRRADGAHPALPPIVGEPIALALPQQTDAWPRYVLVVVQDPDDETVVPMSLMLEQASPRENYRVQYAVSLQPTQFPDVAAASVGAIRYSTENKLLKLTPAEVAAAYANVLEVGAASEYADEFDLENDTFLARAGPEARAERAAQVSGPATLATTPIEGTGERIALATNDTGAILALSFGDQETVTPTEAKANITVGAEVKLMTGLTETTKGVYANFGYQLLFYVPPAGSDKKIRLLGATQGITSAGEL